MSGIQLKFTQTYDKQAFWRTLPLSRNYVPKFLRNVKVMIAGEPGLRLGCSRKILINFPWEKAHLKLLGASILLYSLLPLTSSH